MSALAVVVREKRYPARPPQPALTALAGLSLGLDEGEFVCVFGPSGCGKTTLLHIVAGLDAEFDGTVAFADGRRPTLGYVFQTPRLLPWRSVRENIALVLPPGADAEADALIEAVELAGFGDAYPGRLSLGMQRRAALARAFAVHPGLLLMDEPFVSLDEPTARRLRLLLHDIWRSRPATVLFVTHNLREAIELADRIVFLSSRPGKVVAETPVGLSRAARADEAAVEAFRAELMAREVAVFNDAAP
ncbi:MAG: ABC transporter ATP-binding protein [Alphaproteobacteria bacterium]